jgi:hypothetical protein
MERWFKPIKINSKRGSIFGLIKKTKQLKLRIVDGKW